MVKYVCDNCGAQMQAGELRYQVKIEVQAAYDEMTISLLDLVRDHKPSLEKVVQALDDADVDELEAQVYKQIKLDLCPKCQRRFITAPLHMNGEATDGAPAVDIDTFLRSLGYGESDEASS